MVAGLFIGWNYPIGRPSIYLRARIDHALLNKCVLWLDIVECEQPLNLKLSARRTLKRCELRNFTERMFSYNYATVRINADLLCIKDNKNM